MKLLVVLSVIAIGYADKLDRTYLPPSSAASAGGSPGALTAPAFQSGPSFGQGLQSGSGSTPGPAGFTPGSAGFTPRPSGFSPGPAGDAQGPLGFGQGPSGPSQGSPDLGQGPAFGQKLSAYGQGPSGSSQGPSSFGQGPSGFNQGPSSFSQGPSAFNQGPSSFSQGPLAFNQGPSSFGQGPSGVNQGSSGFSRGPSGASQGPSNFGQGPSKSEQPSSVSESANNGVQSGNGFVSTQASATPGNSYDAAFETRIPSAPSGFGSPQIGPNQAGQFANSPFNQGFGQGSFGSVGPQVYTPERPQAAADRSATILNYFSENNGDSYKYNYETSNGISAGEEGVATNGVRAQGGYSYIGDDGVSYSVTYTADENGYQPQGDHIPTPHPIPEEILKSIEENARAAAAGTQEGAYRPEEYESESPQSQYNAGPAGFNQPQGPNTDAIQGLQSAQGQFNRPDSNQFPGSLDQFTQRRPIGISGQYGQGSAGSSGQFDGKTTADLSQNSQGQGQGANGYNYKQPQGPSSQFRPQVNAQEQTDLSVNIGSTKVQSNTAPSANGITGISSISSSQNQYQTGLGQSNTLPVNKADTGRTSSQAQRPSFGSSQGYQYTPGSTPFGPTGTSGQGSQYQQNTNQNALGVNGPNSDNQNTGAVIGQGNQNQYGNKQPVDSIVDIAKTSPFAYNQNSQSSSSFGRGPQQNGNQAALGSNLGSNQGSSQYGFNNQAFGSTTPTPVRGSQFNGNQPTFGSNIGSNQGTQQFGTGNQASGPSVSATAGVRDSQSIQAPYQYNRPSQGFNSQPQRPGFNGAQGPTSVNQGGQRGSEQFGEPRQPPSFTPEEGYKY